MPFEKASPPYLKLCPEDHAVYPDNICKHDPPGDKKCNDHGTFHSVTPKKGLIGYNWRCECDNGWIGRTCDKQSGRHVNMISLVEWSIQNNMMNIKLDIVTPGRVVLTYDAITAPVTIELLDNTNPPNVFMSPVQDIAWSTNDTLSVDIDMQQLRTSICGPECAPDDRFVILTLRHNDGVQLSLPVNISSSKFGSGHHEQSLDVSRVVTLMSDMSRVKVDNVDTDRFKLRFEGTIYVKQTIFDLGIFIMYDHEITSLKNIITPPTCHSNSFSCTMTISFKKCIATYSTTTNTNKPLQKLECEWHFTAESEPRHATESGTAFWSDHHGVDIAFNFNGALVGNSTNNMIGHPLVRIPDASESIETLYLDHYVIFANETHDVKVIALSHTYGFQSSIKVYPFVHYTAPTAQPIIKVPDTVVEGETFKITIERAYTGWICAFNRNFQIDGKNIVSYEEEQDSCILKKAGRLLCSVTATADFCDSHRYGIVSKGHTELEHGTQREIKWGPHKTCTVDVLEVQGSDQIMIQLKNPTALYIPWTCWWIRPQDARRRHLLSMAASPSVVWQSGTSVVNVSTIAKPTSDKNDIVNIMIIFSSIVANVIMCSIGYMIVRQCCKKETVT